MALPQPGCSGAAVEWLADGTPRSRKFDDVYYSGAEGLAESRHVFLHHNDLTARFATAGRGCFTVGETGFGTGLNFLACWQLWLEQAPAEARLQFLTVEKYPLDARQLARSHRLWDELQPLSAILQQAYPPALPGVHTLEFDHGRVRLVLFIGDVQDAIQQWRHAGCTIDAWFLDGFAPGKNPAMWTPGVLQQLASLSREGTTLATFTAAGQVRRDLADTGFAMEKVAGFGRKRDMLRGRLRVVTPPRQWDTTPWFLPAERGPGNGSVAVVGAGLAGSLIAAQLAQRGLKVTVIDRAPVVAAGASGNPQGIIYTRLSPAGGDLAEYALFSYLYALRQYRAMFASGALRLGRDGELNGVLQLAHEPGLLEQHQRLAQRFEPWPELVQLLDCETASSTAGMTVPGPALLLPGGGWLAPAALCRALLDTPGVELRLQSDVGAIRREDRRWHCEIAGCDGLVADQLVLACGGRIASLLTGVTLPLKPIRGQISLLPWPQELPAPRLPICHEGYIAPPVAGTASIGATFDPGIDHSLPIVADHERNLAQLRRCLPALNDAGGGSWRAETLAGRASVRFGTPDYLPVAGPIPDPAAFERDYAGLSADARRVIPLTGQYQPGLFACSGFGSRGLAYGPLAAALVAAWMLGEVLPVNWQLARAVHPARFLIRAIRRANRKH